MVSARRTIRVRCCGFSSRPSPLGGTLKDLAGKTAVITGAASGMGRAFAERFADAGMNIVLADVEVPRLDEATASVTGRGVEAIAVPTDVADADAVDRLRDAALERFGRVHVVCNNAGVAGSMSRRRHGPRRLALGDRRQPVGGRSTGTARSSRTSSSTATGTSSTPRRWPATTPGTAPTRRASGPSSRSPRACTSSSGLRARRSASRACARGGSTPTSEPPTATDRSGRRLERSTSSRTTSGGDDPRVRPRPAEERDGAGRRSPTSSTTRSWTSASGSSPTWRWSEAWSLATKPSSPPRTRRRPPSVPAEVTCR